MHAEPENGEGISYLSGKDCLFSRGVGSAGIVHAGVLSLEGAVVGQKGYLA